MTGEPDVQRYACELQEMLRQRSPGVYRAFLRTWSDLHQRGVAERLAAQDDDALRLRIERMILDMPALADLHESARTYLAEHGVPLPALVPSEQPVEPPGFVGRSAKPGRVRLRRRPPR